jgi:hypothetical protein
MTRLTRMRSIRGLPITMLCVLAMATQGRAQGLDYWVVSTRKCPQILGSDPVASLQAFRLDSRGRLSRRDPAELVATCRPVIFLVHGSYYTADMAVNEGRRICNDLERDVSPDTIVVSFTWPSHRGDTNLVLDANDKARRAFVAGYHLARFIQRFPPGGRVSLIGHSHGGLTVLAALHLLGGGTLDDGADATALQVRTQPPRLRAVVIASACDHHWLDPGERFGRAIAATEGILCLYNRLDPVLIVHPFGQYSDHRQALGKVGIFNDERTSPRYSERSIGFLIGPRHTFRGTTVHPLIARWLGPYVWSERPATAIASDRRPLAGRAISDQLPEGGPADGRLAKLGAMPAPH